MIKILKLALPWILIIGSILVLQSERLPSYFSRLFSGLFFLYLFLYNLRKIYKNPKKKLEWVEYLELILSPLASLFAFYAFWVQMTRQPLPRARLWRGDFCFCVTGGSHSLRRAHSRAAELAQDTAPYRFFIFIFRVTGVSPFVPPPPFEKGGRKFYDIAISLL